jgi:hypothetical protein
LRVCRRSAAKLLTRDEARQIAACKNVKLTFSYGKETSCEGLQMVDIAKARETAKNLREWAKQIRRDAVTVSHATAREDSRLLDNAAKQLEEACKELERPKRKAR